MATFDITYYKIIQPHEGYFANLKGDKGGVTYGGIARNIFPNWNGWPIVDSYIRQKGGLEAMKNNERIPAADPYVTTFFRDMWFTNKMDQISSQDVANIYFDWIVNSGSRTATKKVQQILSITDDGLIGRDTLTAINNANPAELNNRIKEERRNFYIALKQENFIGGWLKRLSEFPTLPVNVQKGISGVLLVAAATGLYILLK